MKIKEAKQITGSMTRTSKMPGLSYSLPAWECKTGSKLRKVKNSVCSMCYALKGNYTRYKAIKAAQYVRLKAIAHPLWVDAMTAQVKRQKYFRWHDAGDVQNLVHLNKIYEVCRLTPSTNISRKSFSISPNSPKGGTHPSKFFRHMLIDRLSKLPKLDPKINPNFVQDDTKKNDTKN